MQEVGVIVNGEITNTNPRDLKPLPPLATTPPGEVAGLVARARVAQKQWESLSFSDRAARLKAACKAMLKRRQEVVDLLAQEIGKYPADTLMSEALGPLDYLNNWIKVVRPYLRPRRLPISALAFPGKQGFVEILPRGVIGIIAPWNFPLAYFFKPVLPALLCGDAVVMKPSEFAPRTPAWFASILSEHVPKDLVQCLQGGPEVGRALIQGGIDALTFTGSINTGREVARLAAEQMIPLSCELGGKDPAIVLPDCNLPRTVAGILNWAMSNVGQSCGAIERVYVIDAIADDFVAQLTSAVSRLRTGPGADDAVDLAPIATRRQLEIIEAHVADAVAKGAKLLTGGKPTGKGNWFAPTVLDRCDHTMRVVTEETFGPVIAVLRVPDVNRAVEQANQSIYGLNASIWSSDLTRARELARRLDAGTVFINNHAVTGAMPCAPWTGVKQSGYGIANSEFALANFTRPRTILVDKNANPDPWWFPMDEVLSDLGNRLAEAQLGNLFGALKVPFLLRKRVKTILEFVKPRQALPPKA
jgi:acyl-CoA reductase-like NAD-dependent aldehyde dehydrogenase